MHQPYSSLGMNTDQRDINGRPVRIACTVCHGQMAAKSPAQRALGPANFHQGVKIFHAGQACEACHNPPRYDTFRLAHGQAVEYGNVVQLCAQCHGRQWRDYRHGAHGGMTGYWDETAGPRDRNHCLDCHNPHQPTLPRMMPAPRPNYRFLGPKNHD